MGDWATTFDLARLADMKGEMVVDGHDNLLILLLLLMGVIDDDNDVAPLTRRFLNKSAGFTNSSIFYYNLFQLVLPNLCLTSNDIDINIEW